MKASATRYPIVFGVAISLLGVYLQLWPMLVSGLSVAEVALLGKATILAFVLALLASLGWWRQAGLALPSGWRSIPPFLPMSMRGLLQPRRPGHHPCPRRQIWEHGQGGDYS